MPALPALPLCPLQTTKIEPHFNRLTVFDPRFPHGVSLVEGTMNPLQASSLLDLFYFLALLKVSLKSVHHVQGVSLVEGTMNPYR